MPRSLHWESYWDLCWYVIILSRNHYNYNKYARSPREKRSDRRNSDIWIYRASLFVRNLITLMVRVSCDCKRSRIIIDNLSKLIRLTNQGATWPAIQPMTARWIPPMERSKFVSHMMGKWSWSNSPRDHEIQANRCHNCLPSSFLSLKKLQNVYAR